MVFYRKRLRRRKRMRFARRKALRRRAAKRKWRNFLFTQKQQIPQRKFIEENRSGTHSIAASLDSVRWQVKQCLGSPLDDETYVNNSSKADLGQGGAVLGDMSNFDNDQKNDNSEDVVQRNYIYGEKMTVHYVNISLIPVHMTMYEIIAKRDIYSATLTDCRHQLMEDFFDGIQDYMGAGTAAPTTVYEGDQIIDGWSPPATTAELRSKFISPQQSLKFNLNWRVVKKKYYKLSPGDEVFWNMKTSAHIYDPMKENARAAPETEQKIARKRITRLLLTKVHGSMCATTTDAAECGFGKVRITGDTIRSAKVLPLNYSERQLSHYLLKDADADLTSIVAPGYHDDKADE